MPNSRELTVLIVGAGASAAYGLPLGHALNKQLWDTSIRQAPVNMVPQEGSEQQAVMREAEDLRMAFMRSGQASIDAFLAAQKTHGRFDLRKRIGKIAISLALLRAESSALQSPYGGWLSHVFRAMQQQDKQLEKHTIRIITFNYDRTVELMLAAMLCNSHQVEPNEAIVRTSRFVKHVYGALPGTIEWDSQFHFFRIRELQSPAFLAATHCEAARTLRTIDEERLSGEHLASLQEWLLHAKQIVFLGFGFAEENLSVLAMRPEAASFRPPHYDDIGIAATGYGLSEHKRSRIGNLMRFSYRKVLWGDEGDDCDAFFEKRFTISP